MVLLIHEKEDKKLAIKISKRLESSGFKCTLDNIETIKQNSELPLIETAIMIFSQKSNLSEKIMKEYDEVFENEIPLIPFVVTDVELSVAMQHFFNSHDWINAYDISTDEAIKDLSILVNENINDVSGVPVSTKKNKVVGAKSTNKNQTYVIIGISAVFLLIIMYFIFGNKNNNPLSSGSSPEELIVGNWKMANYQDNMPRQPNEYADFIKNITALKQNFLLKLNEDNSFNKYGFSQDEKGNWQIDPQNMVLYMWPPGSDEHKDMLQIEKLTADSLIMSIATQVDSTTQIITRFSLYKE